MRQFIESMFYLDVVRCRKCRGGVGEFCTAPALFLHRASIYFLHKTATRKSGSLFYFFDFLFQPIKAALCVYSFRNITNTMANDNFYRIFVKASTLSHRYELDARIMWFMICIKTKHIATARAFYSKRIELIDKVIDKLNPSLAPYVKMGVTEELTYDVLQIRGCPCCRDMYYAEYRYFFWRLSIERQ